MRKTEKSRGDRFSSKITTSICNEVSSANPFVADSYSIHGYDHLELSTECTFMENIYLVLKGEIPSKAELASFSFLLNLGLSIGARSPASRSVMNAGVSKTKIEHLLPIGLNVASGEHNGAAEVSSACRFILKEFNSKTEQGFSHKDNCFPGFGLVYGSIDSYVQKLALVYQANYEVGQYFNWSNDQVSQSNGRFGFLLSGLFAAVALDLKFDKKAIIALFQISISPLLCALGIEKSNQPLTAMPFISEENYKIGK